MDSFNRLQIATIEHFQCCEIRCLFQIAQLAYIPYLKQAAAEVFWLTLPAPTLSHQSVPILSKPGPRLQPEAMQQPIYHPSLRHGNFHRLYVGPGTSIIRRDGACKFHSWNIRSAPMDRKLQGSAHTVTVAMYLVILRRNGHVVFAWQSLQALHCLSKTKAIKDVLELFILLVVELAVGEGKGERGVDKWA